MEAGLRSGFYSSSKKGLGTGSIVMRDRKGEREIHYIGWRNWGKEERERKEMYLLQFWRTKVIHDYLGQAPPWVKWGDEQHPY